MLILMNMMNQTIEPPAMTPDMMWAVIGYTFAIFMGGFTIGMLVSTWMQRRYHKKWMNRMKSFSIQLNEDPPMNRGKDIDRIVEKISIK